MWTRDNGGVVEGVRLGRDKSNLTECLTNKYGLPPSVIEATAPPKVRLRPYLPQGPHARPERPPHLYPEMMHPALREKGRALPQRTIDKQPRAGPMPGVRPPMGGPGGMVPPPQSKGSGAMGIIMPLYTVGIVVFFVYTIMKVLFKKEQDEDKTPKLKDFGLDPEYRKYVFAEEYLDNADTSTRDQFRRQQREESRSRRRGQQEAPEVKIGGNYSSLMEGLFQTNGRSSDGDVNQSTCVSDKERSVDVGDEVSSSSHGSEVNHSSLGSEVSRSSPGGKVSCSSPGDKMSHSSPGGDNKCGLLQTNNGGGGGKCSPTISRQMTFDQENCERFMYRRKQLQEDKEEEEDNDDDDDDEEEEEEAEESSHQRSDKIKLMRKVLGNPYPNEDGSLSTPQRDTKQSDSHRTRGDTSHDLPYTKEGDTDHNLLYTQQGDTDHNLLYTQGDTDHDSLYTHGGNTRSRHFSLYADFLHSDAFLRALRCGLERCADENDDDDDYDNTPLDLENFPEVFLSIRNHIANKRRRIWMEGVGGDVDVVGVDVGGGGGVSVGSGGGVGGGGSDSSGGVVGGDSDSGDGVVVGGSEDNEGDENSNTLLSSADIPNLERQKVNSAEELVVEEVKSKEELVAEEVKSKEELVVEEVKSEAELVAEEVKSAEELVAEEVKSEAELVAEEVKSEEELVAEEVKSEAELGVEAVELITEEVKSKGELVVEENKTHTDLTTQNLEIEKGEYLIAELIAGVEAVLQDGSVQASAEYTPKDEQLDHLRRRLEETEKAMERLMCQMGSVTDKLTAAKITEVLSQAQAQARILKEYFVVVGMCLFCSLLTPFIRFSVPLMPPP
ncbi:hypothetical protein Pmani_032606 [Petrolisthes manimaculis]|uniref:Resistance to inhibitors of cholinesterase protein 3 N-terminal domain-containing protein n=1 Tax=Petrolisthes manimaculis TaxID=1843537 RepID=A0AAE1NSB3_9EUCA|nr:hypothetical protein Pmani_032606 [Petrolisthes manimaculis]